MKMSITREQAHELLDLCLDINGIEERHQELTGNLPTVFFEFNGHTAGIHVRVYEEGWTERANCTNYFTVYCDKNYAEDKFEATKEYLLSIKKDRLSGNSKRSNQ